MVSGSAMFGLTLLSILLIILVLPAALATKASILFPLYIYPGKNAVNWKPLFTQIRAYPKVQFEVIVNPNNGPGVMPYDQNYTTGLELLNSFNNVLVYGYVDTSYGNYNDAHIEHDLDLWAAYGDNAPTGIFFDDVLTNSASVNAIMQQVTSYAVNTDGFDATQIVFNCGALPPADSPLYDSASQVVIYENVYSSDTSIVGESGQGEDQLTVLFYSGSSTTSVVTTEVDTWCGLVDSMFITDVSNSNPNGGAYGTFGSQLAAFVSAINSCPH